MKVTSACILLAVLLCSAVVAGEVYASTCQKCKSIGASFCGSGTLRTKGFLCQGQTAIRSCNDCRAHQGRCVSSDCYL
ncbi:uncharacterized protein LOC125950823 [Anopheles darlingi]|uniref:uncharacterized protein LOC125950823 n=1 Tax=Anopheles darlingi TaxID=43151 RepID=UPI0021004BB5|nr:uncharacterized protein LOC125950823 [Anopheles darlingi]